MKTIYPKSIESLKEHIKTHIPSLYVMSKTSTVIAFDRLEQTLSEQYLVDLSSMPTHIELAGDDLIISGAVTWQDAIDYLKGTQREIMTYPTDKSACVLAGLATSCTGEMAFGYGTFREQVLECEYLNYKGELKKLTDKKHIIDEDYKLLTDQYKFFKNPPMPRFDRECDLMIGTEGQLGVITSAKIKTTKRENYTCLFIKLPKWEDDYKAHLEIVEKVQAYRRSIRICEFLDSNSLTYLKEPPFKDLDLIVLEVRESELENIFENFLMKLEHINDDDIFEINRSKFLALRVEIPRSVNEENARAGVVKKGTDAQVSLESFQELMDFYRSWSKLGVRYNLFGHLGDCHLHFNFNPEKKDENVIKEQLLKFYDLIFQFKGSPFAEHGIGLVKQVFIKKYHQEKVLEIFSRLKRTHDPEKQFFLSGWLN